MSQVQNHCHPHAALPSVAPQPWGNYTTTRIPHTCPVCQGKGEHPRGFYGPRHPAEGKPDKCRSCEKGIVWETRQEYSPTWTYWPTVTYPWAAPVSVTYDTSAAAPAVANTYQTYQSTDGPGTFLGQNGIRVTFGNDGTVAYTTDDADGR